LASNLSRPSAGGAGEIGEGADLAIKSRLAMSITRFTIVVAGQPRSLFSITERGDEVTIGLKSPFGLDRAGLADHPTETPNIQPSAIREHRFSIHPSHKSAKGISAIKMTRILANGRKDYSRHYTKVIKKGNKFALIYARRCGQLDRPEFVPTGNFTNISLGTYDPAAFTLIYSIVIAAKGLKFDPAPNPNLAGLNILETDFKNLRIIVLWTFVNIPSRPYFFSVAATTIPDIDFLMEGESHSKSVSCCLALLTRSFLGIASTSIRAQSGRAIASARFGNIDVKFAKQSRKRQSGISLNGHFGPRSGFSEAPFIGQTVFCNGLSCFFRPVPTFGALNKQAFVMGFEGVGFNDACNPLSGQRSKMFRNRIEFFSQCNVPLKWSLDSMGANSQIKIHGPVRAPSFF
jgi:hypothetical protein